jgi:uncharacterized protein YkwD
MLFSASLVTACAPRALERPAPAAFAPLLARVNEVRRSGYDCGPRGRFGPAPTLSWNERLAAAALQQGRDMAQGQFFSHSGSDGSSVGQRAARAGYAWVVVGETLAYATPGHFTPESVVDAWLTSPGHCATLLEPDFRELGAAEAEGDLEYWAVVLGTPRKP